MDNLKELLTSYPEEVLSYKEVKKLICVHEYWKDKYGLVGNGILLIEDNFLKIRIVSKDLVEIDSITMILKSSGSEVKLSKSMEVINYILNTFPIISAKKERKDYLKKYVLVSLIRKIEKDLSSNYNFRFFDDYLIISRKGFTYTLKYSLLSKEEKILREFFKSLTSSFDLLFF